MFKGGVFSPFSFILSHPGSVMIQKIMTYTNVGLEGFEIIVEADSNQ